MPGDDPTRLLVVFGTRPEAIKMAPLLQALDADCRFTATVAVTAQHRQMLEQVLTLFGIVPTVDLDVIVPRQSLTDITVRVLDRLGPVLAERQPQALIVQGDTTTTFAAALAAFYQRIPVVHLEAGLRTDDPYSPYPEEINRRLTSQLAALHLAPTETARRNLERDGVAPERIVVTGNTVIDALLWSVTQPSWYDDPRLAAVVDDPRRLLLVTAHRRESWGPALVGLGRALAQLATRDDLLVVLPLHRNPAVRESLLPVLDGHPNVVLTEPIGYAGFCRLMARADVVLTDSGGIQEEAPSLGKPVLVIRDTTERPEATYAGTARLIGTDQATVVAEVTRLLDDPAAYAAMATAVNPYGDGAAAARAVAALAHFFGFGPPAMEFAPASDQPPAREDRDGHRAASR